MPKNRNPILAKELEQIRRHQTQRLWDLGVGPELGFGSFEEFLNSIPPVRFTRTRRCTLVILVPDSRIGVTRLCQLLKIGFTGDDQTFVNQKTVPKGPYWINFGIYLPWNKFVYSGTAIRGFKFTTLELLSAYAQIPELFHEVWKGEASAKSSTHKNDWGSAILHQCREPQAVELRYDHELEGKRWAIKVHLSPDQAWKEWEEWKTSVGP